MATITIQADPLPTNFRGTPQEFLEALVERLRITTDIVGFVVSDTQPAGNQGPWLKYGRQIWVWDEDTATYVPLDVSPSVTNEIWIGEAPPAPISDVDSTPKQRLWFKLNGTTVVGLFYWAGDTLGWVTKASELGPNTISSVMLQDGSVTTEKLANLSVTAAKIQDDLPLNKLVKGAARRFLRMDSQAANIRWDTYVTATTELSIQLNTVLEVEHGLGTTPTYVRGVLVCKEAEWGWAVDDELELWSVLEDVGDGWDGSTLYVNNTKVGIIVGRTPTVRKKDAPASRADITLAKWKIKFYLGVG